MRGPAAVDRQGDAGDHAGVFRTRCPYALPACAKTVPMLSAIGPGHLKACIRDDVP